MYIPSKWSLLYSRTSKGSVGGIVASEIRTKDTRSSKTGRDDLFRSGFMIMHFRLQQF